MSKQYFENNDDLSRNIQKLTYYYKGNLLQFNSDNGVFSKTSIDFGSHVLLKNVIVEGHETNILDVGCGYGTIGLSLAKVYPYIHIDMVDINQRALELAKQNALQMKLNNVNIWESFAYANVSQVYDIIITNPPIRAGKKVVHDILLNAFHHLVINGSLWCVIQGKQGAPSAFAALKMVFSNVVVVEKEKGYWIIQAKK